MTPLLRRFLLCATLLPSLACASARQAAPESAGSGTMSDAEIEALYRERTQASRSRFTEADASFMSRMIHHHAQAIEMAELVPGRAAHPQMPTLAGRIINAQNDEIATMRRWLEERGLPLPPTAAEMASHAAMGHGAAHPADMPGMATPEQMAALRASRGAEFDRLFLTLMIDHHEGAVTMVRELFATDGAAQDNVVFKFASDAQVDQSTEIARMRLMLEAMQ